MPDRASIPRHYPYVTRILLGLFQDGQLPNVEDVIVEPEYGWVARIAYSDGGIRLTRGNDVGLNSGAAKDVLKDKQYTKFLLRTLGFECPRGDAFLLPWWIDQIGEGLAARGFTTPKSTTAAAAFVEEELGYPVFVKPVDGSKGQLVRKCYDAADLAGAIEDYGAARITVMVVEEAVTLPEYRVVVLNGSVISAYSRAPLAVAGNGESTVQQLFDHLVDDYEARDREVPVGSVRPRVEAKLAMSGLTWAFVPASGEQVQLLDVANLSLGGAAEDVTGQLDQAWRQLAVSIAEQLGVAFCGLDICCEASKAGGPYAVLEVNGMPGLDHYAAVGREQRALVRSIYTEVLNASPVTLAQAQAAVDAKPSGLRH
jgi:D-alanine-D-alanine ligase-like ATP-grasp enzyme